LKIISSAFFQPIAMAMNFKKSFDLNSKQLQTILTYVLNDFNSLNELIETMKFYNYIITSIFILTSVNVHLGQSYVVDKVVAKVGSEFVLLSEVEDQYAYSLTQDPTLGEDIKCQILDNLIAQKLIIYQAKLDSVEVSEQEVEAQLDLRFDNILRQMNGDEEFFAEYYGAGVVEMKERYRDDQRQQILAERMQMKLINSVTITPDEVQQFYNSIPQDSLPYLDSEKSRSQSKTGRYC